MFKKIFMFSAVSFKICDRNLHQLPCYTVIVPEDGIRLYRRLADAEKCGMDVGEKIRRVGMKRFLKRANRGLILAALILVGLLIYIQVDQYQFNSAKPEIEQMTRNYLEQVKEINKQQPQEKMEQTKALLDQYWTDGRNLAMGINKDNMESYLEYRENKDFTVLEEYADRVESVSAKKSGPQAATVTVSYEVSLQGSGSMSVYSIYGLDASWYDAADSGEGADSETRRYTLRFRMTRESDGWKISSLESSYGMAQSAAADTVS